MEKKLTKKTWFNIILFSLTGQLAWNVENMCFNVFMYNSIYADATQEAASSFEAMSAVNVMVACSAVVAVLTTFIMGNLSDKFRNRRLFISVGYIAWGFVTALFGFITKDNISSLTGITDEVKLLLASVWAVIIMDCIMTAMGSTSNDSAFNAWVTDITTPAVRPTVETVLAVLPLVATVVVLGFNTLAQAGTISYTTFFIGLGVFVILCGVLGLFILEEPKSKSPENEKIPYFKNLVYTFRPSVIKANSRLYLALAALCCLSVAFQTFFPYFFIYIQHALLPGLETMKISALPIIAVVIGLAVSVAVAVVFMKMAAKDKKSIFIPSIVFVFAGLMGAMLAGNNIFYFIAFALPAVVAYFIFSIQLGALVRDFTPDGKAGLFQGVRMIFVVLIPMVIGPKLGEIASMGSQIYYENEVHVQKLLPSASMFAYAAVAAAVALIPLIILMKKGIEVKEEQK